jgi:hypothetical protein
MVFAAKRDRANGSLDGVVVEFDAPVVQKQAKAGPTGQGITDRFGKVAVERS